MCQRKKITQKNIYVVRQFAYINGVVVISLFSGNNTRCGCIVFSLKITNQTLVSKQRYFTPTQDSQWAKHGPKIFLSKPQKKNFIKKS